MLTPADCADSDAILGIAHNELKRLTDPNAHHPHRRIKVSEIRTGLSMSCIFNAVLSLIVCWRSSPMALLAANASVVPAGFGNQAEAPLASAPGANDGVVF